MNAEQLSNTEIGMGVIIAVMVFKVLADVLIKMSATFKDKKTSGKSDLSEFIQAQTDTLIALNNNTIAHDTFSKGRLDSIYKHNDEIKHEITGMKEEILMSGKDIKELRSDQKDNFRESIQKLNIIAQRG